MRFASILLSALTFGQTINSPIIPINGAPTLLAASYSPAGQVIFERVALPTGYSVSRSSGILTVAGPAVPPQPPALSTVAWMPLTQSTADSSGLTWCIAESPLQHAYTATMIQESRTQTEASTGQTWTYDTFSPISLMPNSVPSGTSPASIPPVWFKTACGGNPGVNFPSNWLGTGEKRNSVQALVVY